MTTEMLTRSLLRLPAPSLDFGLLPASELEPTDFKFRTPLLLRTLAEPEVRLMSARDVEVVSWIRRAAIWSEVWPHSKQLEGLVYNIVDQTPTQRNGASSIIGFLAH